MRKAWRGVLPYSTGLEVLEQRQMLSTVVLGSTNDTYVRGGSNANNTYESIDPNLLIVRNDDSSGGTNSRQTYLQFDLSTLPVGSIVSAQLVLTGAGNFNNGKANATEAYGVPNNAWTEGTLTYNNKPATDATVLDTQYATTGSQIPFTWNVTSWVTSHLGGPISFNVQQNMPENGSAREDFLSKEGAAAAGNPSLAPTLIINVNDANPYTTPTAAPKGVVFNAMGTGNQLLWFGSPDAATYSIQRSSVSGGPYTQVGTSTSENFVDTTATPGQTYFYVVAGVGANGTAGPVSNEVGGVTSSVPAGWQGTDIGFYGTDPTPSKGGVQYDSGTGTFTLSAAGSDIWDGGDHFYYTYQPIGTEGSITARVTSFNPADPWSKAGVMFRTSNSPYSMHAFMCVTGGNGTSMQGRVATDPNGSDTNNNTGGTPTLPEWLRITRVGNTFYGYYAADAGGSPGQWILYSTRSIPEGLNVEVGLALTAHNNGSVATATFDNVTVQSGPAALTLTNTIKNGAYNLSWNPDEVFATGYTIERSTDPAFGTFDTIPVAAPASSFIDTPADPTKTYYYRLSYTSAAGTSPQSNVVGGTVSTGLYAGPGVIGEYYQNDGWNGKPVTTRQEPAVQWGANPTMMPPAPLSQNEVSAVWNGQIKIDTAGSYSFFANSDDGSALLIDGQQVASDPGYHGEGNGADTTPVTLTAGLHDFTFAFFNGGGGWGATALWQGPSDTAPTPIPNDHLFANISAPAAPSNLTIVVNPNDTTHNGATQLSFTNNATNQAGFIIQRALDPSFANAENVYYPGAAFGSNSMTTASATPANPFPIMGETLTWNDSLTLSSTHYYYRVEAYNPAGISAPSSSVDFTTPATFVPTNPGLLGHYYSTSLNNEPTPIANDLSGGMGGDNTGVFVDNPLNVNGGTGWAPFPLQGNNNFSVRWTGKILIDTAGSYDVIGNSDDANHIYIDGKLASEWPNGHGTWDLTGTAPMTIHDLTLSAGLHNIVVTYAQGGGGYAMELMIGPGGSNTGPAFADVASDHIQTSSDLPGAPTNLIQNTAALTTTSAQIKFTDASTNELQFTVERSTDSTFSDPTQVAVAGSLAGINGTGGVLTFNDSGLTKSTNYWYRIAAVNYDGSGAFSTALEVTTPAVDVVPPDPTNVVAASPASYAPGNSAVVDWTNNSGNDDKYEVWRSGDGGTTFTQVGTVAADTNVGDSMEFIDTSASLVLGNSYIYEVRAHNYVGFSNFVQAPPVTITAVVPGTGVGLVGNYYTNPGGDYAQTFPGNTNPADIIAASTLMATRLDGVIDFDFATFPNELPQSVAVEEDATIWTGYVQPQVTGLFTFATLSDDGSAVYLNNNLTSPNVDNRFYQARTFRSGAPIFLTAGSLVPITVTFWNGGGGSNMTLQWEGPGMTGFQIIPTSQLYPTNTPPAKPAAPTNVAAGSTGTYNTAAPSVGVGWQNNALDDTGYFVERSTDGGATWTQVATVGANGTLGAWMSYTDNAVTVGNTYEYRVRDKNAFGFSDYGGPASVTVAAASVLTGTGVGLGGSYYNEAAAPNVNPPLSELSGGTLAATRLDPVIDFDFAANPNNPAGFATSNQGVIWTGFIQAQVTGMYTIGTASDDGSAVFIGTNTTVPMSSNYQYQGRTERTGTVFLQAGQLTPINVAFYNGGGGSNITLYWQGPGMSSQQIVPSTQLYPIVTGGPSAVTDLTAISEHPTTILLVWTPTSGPGVYTETQTLDRAPTAGGPWTNIATLGASVGHYVDTTVPVGQTMFYRVIEHNTSGDSGPSNSPVSGTSLADNLPAPWQHQDVGTVGLPGDSSYDSTSQTFTLLGSGDDIWNANDRFQFAYQKLPNTDVTIIAHVSEPVSANAALPAVDTWSKAGVMIRTGLDSTALKAFAGATPAGHDIVEFTGRLASESQSVHLPDDASATNPIGTPANGVWIKLVRVNNTFDAFTSDDGTTYTEIGTVGPSTIPMDASNIYVGLGISAHNQSALSMATFDHVQIITPADSNAAPAAASAVTASDTGGSTAGPVGNGLTEVTWTDNSDNESGFKISRSSSAGGPWTQVAMANANATEWTDHQVPAGTWFYQVVATNSNAPAGSQDASPAVSASGVAAATSPAVLNFTDFSDTSALGLNGNAAQATVNGKKVLQLTAAANSQHSSAWTVAQYDVTTFETTFDFVIPASSGSPADGMTFTIQNDASGATALGGGGGSLGYQDNGTDHMTPSVAVKFDLYPNTEDTTGLYYNGMWPGETDNQLSTNLPFTSGDTMHVDLKYDGNQLQETITDTNTNATFTHTYTVDIPTIVGSPMAYIGFTGATGGANAEQDILNWKFDNSKQVTLASPLVISGSADYVKLVGGIIEVWPNTDGSGAPSQQQALSATTEIDWTGTPGNDTLVLDLSGGAFLPPGGLKIDGGAGIDTVLLKGYSGPFALPLPGITAVNIEKVGFEDGAVTLAAAPAGLGLVATGTATVTLTASMDLPTLDITGNAKVVLAAGGTKALSIGGGTATASSLNISGNGILDINDNGLILAAGNAADRDALLAVLIGLIKSARGTNGAWAGTTGVLSSNAKADYTADPLHFTTGIALTSNIKLDQNGNVTGALKSTFKGTAVDQNAVLAAYSFNGDTNLDGIINFDDYFKINTGFLSNGTKTGYQNGDFTFDGLINFDDYFLINTAFLGQGSKVLPPMPKVVAPFSTTEISSADKLTKLVTKTRRHHKHHH